MILTPTRLHVIYNKDQYPSLKANEKEQKELLPKKKKEKKRREKKEGRRKRGETEGQGNVLFSLISVICYSGNFCLDTGIFTSDLSSHVGLILVRYIAEERDEEKSILVISFLSSFLLFFPSILFFDSFLLFIFTVNAAPSPRITMGNGQRNRRCNGISCQQL